ncbi:hypothetical protein RFI_18963, partial [Reticulomyxa filosa]
MAMQILNLQKAKKVEVCKKGSIAKLSFVIMPRQRSKQQVPKKNISAVEHKMLQVAVQELEQQMKPKEGEDGVRPSDIYEALKVPILKKKKKKKSKNFSFPLRSRPRWKEVNKDFLMSNIKTCNPTHMIVQPLQKKKKKGRSDMDSPATKKRKKKKNPAIANNVPLQAQAVKKDTAAGNRTSQETDNATQVQSQSQSQSQQLQSQQNKVSLIAQKRNFTEMSGSDGDVKSNEKKEKDDVSKQDEAALDVKKQRTKEQQQQQQQTG